MEPIAIVGASCRFPGAADIDAFWRLLIGGVDAVSEIDSDRWSTRFFYHPRHGEPGKSYSWAAGLIDGVDQFESGFFGISPREAAEMDPQQRVLLELAWHALEDAGIPPSRLAGSATGVYVGASATDYADLRLGDPAGGGAHFLTGSSLGILANRLSNFFDLRGPSLVIDTACASSLVALHQACEALRGERIDTALVGGINLLLSPYPFIGFSQAGMLSRRGRCFAFDARADGYVRAEGGGVVVLRRLDDALAAGDPIRTVIHATAVNTSGRTAGLSLPSEAAQADLLRAVYRSGGVAPEALAFVEMHGTGTPAGDPVEAAAVGAVLGVSRTEPLPIGSVKTNIGHLEPASGMAGLLKAALALEHGMLPRSLYGETPNPAIPFDKLNLRLTGAAEAIAPGQFAGVNSFGFGGANAHAIVGPPPRHEPIAEDRLPPPLLSAQSEASLRALMEGWRTILAGFSSDRLPALLRAAARRRDHHEHRLVVLGADPSCVLGDYLEGRTSPNVVAGAALRQGKLAFVYPGNGAQFVSMGQAAYRGSAAFRKALAEADQALATYLGWSVGQRITDGVSAEDLRRADIAQPMLFAIQVALTAVLRGLGIAASGFVGHSVGEIAAAWAAGALSLDTAAQVIACRSRHQQNSQGHGRMAALALGEAEVGRLLAELGGGIEIAAVNAVRSVTVAGDTGGVAALGDEAQRRGIACRLLDLDYAFHSAIMEPIRDHLLADLSDVSSSAPTGDLISTVTGRTVAAGSLDAGHWWRNIRDPVRFSAALDVLIADGYRIFVEIGPNPVLQAYLRCGLDAARVEGRAIATLDRRAEIGDPFPAIAAQLHAAGHDISGATWFDGPCDPRGLPLYRWQRDRCWFRPTVEAAESTNPPLDHPLLGFRQAGPVLSWLNHLDTTLFPFLADHRLDDAPVLPAAAIVDMALAAARISQPEAAAVDLRDVELLRPMVFDDATAREVRASLPPDGEWRLASRERLADVPMVTHATARVGAGAPGRLLPDFDGSGERKIVHPAEHYRRARRVGLDYGECFRTVAEIVTAGADRATVALAGVSPKTQGTLIEPALLDGAFQGLLALIDAPGGGAALMLPRRFGRVRAFAPFGRRPCRAELRVTRRGRRSAAVDIALFDEADSVVIELAECWFAALASRPEPQQWRTDLVPAPLGEGPQPAVLDRLPEIVRRAAGAMPRDPEREGEQALLFDALLAAIAREAAAAGEPLATPLRDLLRRHADIELPEVAPLWRRLLADYPEMVTELALAATLRTIPAALNPASPLLAALRQTSRPAMAGRAVIAGALSEIAQQWPRDRPLRVRERGELDFCNGLDRRGDVAVIRVKPGEPCDLAVYAEADACDLSALSANLAPGGALLALAPRSSALWQLDRAADWRAERAAPRLQDIGSVEMSVGPWPCDVVWARAAGEPTRLSALAARSMTLIAEGLAAGFATAIEAAGHRIVPLDGAADAWVLAVGDSEDPISDASEWLPRVARTAASAAGRKIPLWLLTSGAMQQGAADLVGAAAWGFARVLRNEIPGLDLRMVDFPRDMPRKERAACFAKELTAASGETEIVWMPRGRRLPRLRRELPPVWANPNEAVLASIEPPGRLDRLGWRGAQRPSPGPGEVAIQVHAAGVNFRDVMAATGALPEEALLDGFAGAALGLECAGIVTAVGDGVGAIAVGDRVVGLAPAALASRVVARADAVVAIPHELEFAAAATLPVAFITARYALDRLARLTAGESVLIHAASGGVGLAAIQIAKACGAVVIATAGSPEKRAFLRLAGADHVGDSRDLRFVAAVREATDGTGVDVVLNSLSGAAMEASLELLRSFGRFIELGKRDFFENRWLPARLLRQNVSYFAVDVDQLPVQRPELAKALLAKMADALARGEIRPLAHRCFPFAEIGHAFREMQAAQHIGKLILVPDDNAVIALQPASQLHLRRDGVYIVTGGVSGFGLATARWLAEHGAGKLALIGRRGAATPGAAETIAEIEALGSSVSIYAADVADPAALTATLDAVRAGGAPPIRGVFHAAAEIIGGMAADMSAADIAASLHAKLGGAILLDRLTRYDPLDLFWLFSSATTLVGAPGQGAYVAANHALEALARRRHAEGRPALAIAWGPIADAGALGDRASERAALARRLATRPMPAAKALAALPAIVGSGLPVVAVADLRWDEASAALPILKTPFFADVRHVVEAPDTDEDLLGRLAELDEIGRRDLLGPIVAEEAARVLRLAAGALDRQRALAELGMDSLMAMELRLAIEARLGRDLPLMSLSTDTSVSLLAARIAGLLSRRPSTGSVVAIAARHEPSPGALSPSDADLAAEE